MQKIPLKIRILSYVLLLPISLGAVSLSAMVMIFISGHRETGMSLSFILAFPITHYLFGFILLKTKLILKLVIPLMLTLVSFGALELIWFLNLPYLIAIFFNTYGYVDLIILMFFVFVVLWEITYQILIRCLKRTEKLEENPI